jgi:hypothetical protein
VVRAGGLDDPGGGYFDGAPDRKSAAAAQAETSEPRKNAMSAP